MTTTATLPSGDGPANSIDASLARTAARSAELEAEITADPSRFRVLTGDRPTGNLHVGHYFGTLANRVALQRRGVETFVVVADYQVITDRDGVGPIRDRVHSLVTDYLAVGLDPARTTIFAHSAVPALNRQPRVSEYRVRISRRRASATAGYIALQTAVMAPTVRCRERAPRPDSTEIGAPGPVDDRRWFPTSRISASWVPNGGRRRPCVRTIR
jgi:tRNA synthetase class I (W and Y)